TDAKVEFTFSTMYSIYDFEDVDEIPIPRCDNGCLIFASTAGNFKDSDDGMDPYMKNLVVYDAAKDRNRSIAEIAVQIEQGTSKKVPLDIWPTGNFVIQNLNAPEDKGTDVTVWVIEKAKANDVEYEVYDAATMTRAVSAPRKVITIMSTVPFRVMAEPGESNSYTTRLVGFDNALDNNEDKCRYAYETKAGSTFEGFEFHINAPIISFVFNEKNPVNLKADYNYLTSRSLSKSGFISSPGYNGCDRLGGNQVHRSKLYHYSEDFDFHGEPNDYEVFIDADLNLTEGHEIQIKDMSNSQTFPVSLDNEPISHPESLFAQYIVVTYNDITAPQTFILRYSSTLKQKEASPSPQLTS
ncbi:hypothetical protein PENTCL1PPCAC_20211, partial [Pristionchus entomophagus]